MASGIAAGAILASPRASLAVIDINNAIAGDFQRYPGLFPTIAAKVGGHPKGRVSDEWANTESPDPVPCSHVD